MKYTHNDSKKIHCHPEFNSGSQRFRIKSGMTKRKAFSISIVFILALFFGLQTTSAEKVFFSDVSDSPYKEAIYHIQEQGIVDGYADGSFQPAKAINRAEFLKIVIGALSPEELHNPDLKTQCFEDIESSDAWYTPYACLAKEKNIIKGYEGNLLRPGKTINLVEAAKIVANSYTDYHFDETIDPWFKAYMNYLLNNKLLPPTLTQFDQTMTRGSMAELISRVLRLQEGSLNNYLEFRRTNYGESNLLTWQEMSGELTSKTSTDTLIDAYNIPRYSREVISADHPGEYVDGGYLSSYSQWTDASYAPSVSNHSLSLEKESELREDLFRMLNDERRKAEVPELTFDDTLNEAAQNFVEHLVINAFYGHMDMHGRTPNTRVLDLGYEGWVAESMVWKKKNVQEAFDWWKSSPLHWNNIIDQRYNNVGIGVTEEPGGGYMFILLTGE